MVVSIIESGKVSRRKVSAPKIDASYDIVVVGLGTAGAEALTLAAEAGFSTLGVEVRHAMGGNWTLGAINSNPAWPRNVVGLMASFERRAKNANAEIAYESRVAAVFTEGGSIRAIRIVRNGLSRTVAAKMFIDASGNAALALPAGAKVRFGRAVDGAQFTVSRTYYMEKPKDGMGPVYCGQCRGPNGTEESYSSLAIDLSAGRLATRKWKGGPRRVLMASPTLGAREEAGVVTDKELTFKECLFGPRTQKPMFNSWVPYDIHRIGDRAFETDESVNWEILCRMSPFGFPVSVPYQTLLAAGIDNLLVPSRHMGVDRDVLAGLRMVEEMRMSGKAAAIAAVTSLRLGLSLRKVPYAEMRPQLEKAGMLKPLRHDYLSFYSKHDISPFSDDEIVKALARDIGNAVSWVFSHVPDDEDRSSYAYYCCWDIAERGSTQRRKRLTDMLAAEMERCDKRYAANFAVALGIMGDVRSAAVLEHVLHNPGGEYDPPVDYAYPNRLKALCLAGRIDIPGAKNVLLAILGDAGKAFAATLAKAKACDYKRYPGWVYPFSGSMNEYREAAVSLAVVSLAKMLKRTNDTKVRNEFARWAERDGGELPRIKEIRAVARTLAAKI